jgi:NAD(P)-dependent dehydrogenase (short-subunit alcohol dehydrogenase family)
MCGLLLEAAERFAVALDVEHLLGRRRAESTDQLVLEVGGADEEPGRPEIGAEAGPLHRPPVDLALAGVTEAGGAHAASDRPREELPDVRRPADRHDVDTEHSEIEATPQGQRAHRGVVAGALDEHHCRGSAEYVVEVSLAHRAIVPDGPVVRLRWIVLRWQITPSMALRNTPPSPAATYGGPGGGRVIDVGLEGKRAVVIGAGFIPERAGHGRGSALRLAQAGATVACVDMSPHRAAGIVAEIEGRGGRAFAVIGDVSRPEEARRVLDEAVTGLGGLDVCVDVVGEATFGFSADVSDQEWRTQMSKNLDQVFYVFKAATRHLIDARHGGSIVAIASVDGIGASTFHAAYGAAKAGVISLVRSFSDEVGRYGVRVNAVAPGNVGGGKWEAPDVPFGADPANSLAPPRAMDIANAVLFLSSSLAERITGQTIVVDGGALTRSPWGLREEHLAAFVNALPDAEPDL